MRPALHVVASQGSALFAPQALSSFSVTGGPGPFLGHAPLSFVTASDEHLSRIALYRAPKGVALDKVAHYVRRLYGVPKPSTFAYVDGDSTVTSVISNGDFASDTIWTKGAGWTIAAGVASHASSALSPMYQTFTYAAGTWRWSVEKTAESAAGTGLAPRTGGGTAVQGAAMSAGVGVKLGTIVPTSGNTNFGWNASTWVGSIDNGYFYLETASCAPQGDWDYYAIPENVSGIEGPESGPLNVIVV